MVIPSGANMSMGTKTPQWQVVADGEEPIAGIPNVVDDYTIPTRDYANTCIGVPQTLFRPGSGKKIELYPFVGSFYGILGTNRKVGNTDYCTDTQLYDGSGIWSELKRLAGMEINFWLIMLWTITVTLLCGIILHWIKLPVCVRSWKNVRDVIMVWINKGGIRER